MRSEPDRWWVLVMTARPPAFSTAARTASESVATIASPLWASCARRSTWTIIGRPLMSAKGLPGSRVEAMRAGIRMMVLGWVFDIARIPLDTGENRPAKRRKAADGGADTGCQRQGELVAYR